MAKLPLLCGEPTCKTSFEADLTPSNLWPVVCPVCKRSLYPDDILQKSPLDQLGVHPGPLILRDGAKTRSVLSSELRALAGGGPSVGASRSLLDEVLDATEQKARRALTRRIALATAAIVLLMLASWWLTRAR